MMTQLHSKLPLLVSTLLGLLSVQASGEIITRPPLSHNTTLGSSVAFTCVALPDTLVLGWTINGSSALAHKYGAVNSNHDTLTFTTVLTVIASNELNGSVVSCLAWSNQGNANLSSLLLIQGLLQSVDNLSATQINSSFINISFVPPHTLHNVPIASYHLTLRALHTNTTTSIILSNTTLSSLLPLPTQCEEYSISITPVNGAGEGYTATQRIKVIEAPVIETDSVELFIYKSSNESLPQLNISLKITQPNCGSWIHHYVKINTGDHTHSFGPLPLTNGTAELVLSNLTENRFHKLAIWDENVGGVSNTMNTTISSYDVQNVSANSPLEGVLCITCSFMKGSSDIGCYSELTHNMRNTGYTALHIGREKGEESVSGCVTKLEEGLYNIAVYDIETNGRRATPPAVILTDIRIMNSEIMTTSTNTVLPSPTGIIETTTSPSVSLPTVTGEISDSSFSVRPYRDTAIGIGSLLIIMIIVLILLTVYHVRRRRQRKVWETERHHGTLRRTTSFQSRPTDEYEGQPTSELEREVTPSTMSSDEMSPSLAPPPPPPPSSLNTSSPSTMATDLPSPDSQSDTGLMLRDNASGQPRTKRSLVSTLRATPVLSAWAAVNQLASLPISELTEPPPPPSYESALNISTQPFDRPQSVIIPSRININTAQATPPLSARPQKENQFNEYAQLEFTLHPPSLHSPLPPATITDDNEENCWYNPQPVAIVSSPPPAVNGVQYSTINSHNLRTNFKRIPLSHSLV